MAAKLRCEICGGRLIGRPGGIYECENCGMEFDTAWAKSKLQEITGTVRVEGTVEVTGKVKVENGGPSAESLVKRGEQALEDKAWDMADSLFSRALEIQPENGEAFWGKYWAAREWDSEKTALKDVLNLEILEDSNGCWKRAARFGDEKTLKSIAKIEAEWKRANWAQLLPENLRKAFMICDGRMTRNPEGEGWGEIKEIAIPQGVSSIGSRTFRYCKNLIRVTIPDSVKEIGAEAFEECGFSEVVLPESLVEIKEAAFRRCKNLVKVTIPDSVKTIGAKAFEECGFREVTLPDKLVEINASAFGECRNLMKVVIPDSVKTIGAGAFNRTGICEIALPNGVLAIGNAAFEFCRSLVSATIPDSVKTIGERAFFDCGIKEIALPNGLKSLGEEAFGNCQLSVVVLPGSLPIIPQKAFYDCKTLTKVTIENGVELIGRNAFERCKNLKTVSIPDSVKSIEPEAFSSCINLMTVTIPTSMTAIGKKAFYYCRSLYSFAVFSQQVSIAKDALESIPSFILSALPGSTAEAFASTNGYHFAGIEAEDANSVHTAARTQHIRMLQAEKTKLLADLNTKYKQYNQFLVRSKDPRFIAEHRLKEIEKEFEMLLPEEKQAADERGKIARLKYLQAEEIKLKSDLESISGPLARIKKAKIESLLEEIRTELNKMR